MRILIVLCATLATAACGIAGDSSLGKAGEATDGPQQTFEGPVPRAKCGPGSRPETGLQGRVSADDRASGRSMSPYTCNTALVSNYSETGAQWQHTWYEDCAYYGTTPNSGGETPGVQVIDASDPEHPVNTADLNTPAMIDPWESLKTNDRRGLLAAVGAGAIGTFNFDIYDIGPDCRHPRLLQTLPINGVSHEGNWAPDGLTYYGAGFLAPEIQVIDTTNPNTPKPITEIHRFTHGLDFTPDGNTMYLAAWASSGAEASDVSRPMCGNTPAINGLEIYDVSTINTKEPYPVRVPGVARQLGAVYWCDGATAQQPLPVVIQGRKYVIFTDEGGLGMTRIIDVEDPAAPFIVAKLKLEIDMPEAADARAEDEGPGSFAYNGHYCGVDSRDEPTILGCSYFWSGVRFFDIRDPYHPREVAYYNAGGMENPPPGAGQSGGTNAGYASAQVRFVKERGEAWFTDQEHGFYIVKFTNGAWPYKD